MSRRSDAWLRWTPRLLGSAVCLYLGLFALDAAGPVELLVHLAPAAAMLALLLVAWRWPSAGGAGFLAAAALYAVAASAHPTWIAAISGPLILVGLLFIASRHSRARTATA
jgi:hypothetical protein